MSNKRIIIGLTGRFGSGCTETSKFFTQIKKMNYFSISEHLKKIARKKDPEFDRKDPKSRRIILQDLGDDLRSEKKSVPKTIAPIIDEIKRNGLDNVVVECFRNPHEIDSFKHEFGNVFSLLSIDASKEKRWERLKGVFPGDENEFDEIEERDAKDQTNEYGQQVKKCMELADISVNSEDDFYNGNGDKINEIIDGYAQRISDFYDLIKKHDSRPPYPDEVYMHYACSVALQSRCARKQVGAVVVRSVVPSLTSQKKSLTGTSGYVVSTGCNNVPPKEEDCEKKYPEKCYRAHEKNKYFNQYKYCKACGKELVKDNMDCLDCGCKNGDLPGKLLDICRAVHAEEAAIIQAAKLGSTPLNGAKLYTSAFPCMLCCKKIINTGIKHVIYLEAYPMNETLAYEMFANNNVELTKYEGVTSEAYRRFFKRDLK